MQQPRLLPIEPTEEEIQHAAYFRWEQQGRPAGCDRDIWLAAREHIRHPAPAPAPDPHRARAAVAFARDAQPPRRKTR